MPCLSAIPTGGTHSTNQPAKARTVSTDSNGNAAHETARHVTEKDLSEVALARIASRREEMARGGAAETLNELDRSNELHKLHGLNGLHGAGVVREDGAARRRGEGKGVRCTRGWFRVATASIPSHYRWGTRERWHIANGKGHTEGIGGRHRARHWRELWRCG